MEMPEQNRHAALLNDEATALCTQIEKDFLRVLMGGCATPISALAIWKETPFFSGVIFYPWMEKIK
jgi:hydroxymethylbilane synthase